MSKVNLIVDCGTTNLRVTLLDERRQVVDSVKAEGGVRHTAIDGHNGRLKAALRESVNTLLAAHGYDTGDVARCVAYGMITSNVGLLEIPHVIAPASPGDLRAAMREQVFPDVAPFPIAFIPGVRNFAGEVNMDNFAGMDMMRGEETEAVGLYRLLETSGPAVFILPGSHNKFVRMGAAGEIAGCMTSISGELLDAVTHHTILADAAGRSFVGAGEYDSEMACEGAWECARSGLGRAAFAGRILSVLGGRDQRAIQSYLLGATLALDVQAMQAFLNDAENARIFVAGKAPVQQAMCDVLAALSIEGAQQVPREISARMGICGALEIGF